MILCYLWLDHTFLPSGFFSGWSLFHSFSLYLCLVYTFISSFCLSPFGLERQKTTSIKFPIYLPYDSSPYQMCTLRFPNMYWICCHCNMYYIFIHCTARYFIDFTARYCTHCNIYKIFTYCNMYCIFTDCIARYCTDCNMYCIWTNCNMYCKCTDCNMCCSFTNCNMYCICTES